MKMSDRRDFFRYRIIFLVSFVIGLVYVFLVPPWQQNDEPGNFEYAWLFANLDHVPRSNEYDFSMRRQLTASLLEKDFFRLLDFTPNMILTSQYTWIGISQTEGLPAYFFIVSLPLRLLKGTDLVFQLYVARLVSLVFFLSTIYFVLKTFRLIYGDSLQTKHGLIIVAMLPGFVDKMTAVNDDAAAVAFVSLVFWMSLRLYKTGIRISTLIGLLIGIVLCLVVKRTAWIALIPAVISLFLVIFRRKTKLVWMSVLAGLGLVIGLSFSTTDSSPAYFYASSNHSIPLRIRNDQNHTDSYYVRQKGGSVIYQTLDKEDVDQLAGKSVWLGINLWADQVADANLPALIVNDGIVLGGQKVQVNETRQFFDYSYNLPDDTRKLVIRVSTWGIPKEANLNWDCLFLTSEEKANELKNLLNSESCEQFASQPWNYTKNGSADKGWPVLKPEVGQKMDEYFHFPITHLWAVFDLGATGQYFLATAGNLFRTFWGGFGWGGVRLVGSKPYRFFLVLALLAIVGNVIISLKARKKVDWNVFLLMSLPTVLLFTMALFRAAGNWYSYIFTPTARYILPAIIPIILFLTSGWFSLSEIIMKRCFLIQIGTLVIMGLMFLYNLWAWYSIYIYFYAN